MASSAITMNQRDRTSWRPSSCGDEKESQPRGCRVVQTNLGGEINIDGD